jgi:hypothetical protein
LIGSFLLGLLGGCAVWDRLDNAPPPPPTGNYTRQLLQAQANKAEADDFVIYRYEWFRDGPRLGPFGTYHLGEIAKRLPDAPFPVVLEPHPDPELNEVRRGTVVAYLIGKGIPDAQNRVLCGKSEAEGLYAECQAMRIHTLMLMPQSFTSRQSTYSNSSYLGGFSSTVSSINLGY